MRNGTDIYWTVYIRHQCCHYIFSGFYKQLKFDLYLHTVEIAAQNCCIVHSVLVHITVGLSDF